MATVNVAYAAQAALTVTAWTTTLAAGEFATSAIYDNTSNLYVDVLLGGGLATAGTSAAAGETMDVYIVPIYNTVTDTDAQGAIGAALGAGGEEAEDVAFVKANMKLLESVNLEVTAPTTAQTYHWGTKSVVAALGHMPPRFMLMLHNNTGAAMAAGCDVNTIGVTYTSA